MSKYQVELRLNGATARANVEARCTLSDFIRIEAGYTGTHVGCEHGVCGACTVMVDGKAVRSCLMLAVQANGSEVTTIEGLASSDGSLHPVQQAMRDGFGLQCGFCTPGIVMTLASLTASEAKPDVEGLKAALSGHLCRCTGYQGIMRAVRLLVGEHHAEARK